MFDFAELNFPLAANAIKSILTTERSYLYSIHSKCGQDDSSGVAP